MFGEGEEIDGGEAETEETEAGGEEETTSAVETEARKMGWFPKDQFRGDKSRWVDAKTYVERGQQIIPIVNANLKKVQNENDELRGQLSQLQTQLNAATESIEALKQIGSKANLTAAKDARRDLIVQRRKAEEDGDDELAVTLEEQIQDSTAAIKEAEAGSKGTKTTVSTAALSTTPDPTQTPEFRQWKRDNTWFGDDKQRSDYAAFVITQMARTGEAKNFKGQKAILEEVTKRTFEMFGDPDQETTRVSKVEGGKNGTGKGGKSNKSGSGKGGNDTADHTYAELPADAKAACERMAKKLVGAKGSGRAFDDINKYRQHYTTKYFQENPDG